MAFSLESLIPGSEAKRSGGEAKHYAIERAVPFGPMTADGLTLWEHTLSTE